MTTLQQTPVLPDRLNQNLPYLRRCIMKHTFIHILTLFLLGCLTIRPAFSQVGEPRRNIAIGFTGGVALNTIGFDPTIKQNMHMGPTAGIVARFTSEKYFKLLCALQLELNYTQLGWDEKILDKNSDPLPDTYRRHQNYIQMPILARLGLGREEKGFMGFLVAGPQLGYCFGEKTEQSKFTLNEEGLPDRPNNMYSQYNTNIQHKFDYGITAGLGLELSTKIGHFLIEGRYYYGLSDIFNNSKKDIFGRSNNGTILAKFTYLIDIRK